MADQISSDDVLDFWAELGDEGWWKKDLDVDAKIQERFGTLHQQACDGQLAAWETTSNGALALIILLDQFSRNMFRGSPKSFSQDALALEIAKRAIDKGLDKDCREELRVFFYLPYEHCEAIAEQEKSVQLQHSIRSSEESLKAALEHRDIVRRFGRFPHRNPVLGRHTTPAEQAFLDGGGFKG
ncbi:MAG: DUF924 family protein [Pseudomonadota bacterium]